MAARVGMGAPAWNEPEDLESDRGFPDPGRELLLMEGRVMMSSRRPALKLQRSFRSLWI